jgi:hypothetical protein
MSLKICTLSPQGNGVRNGGITRFSGILHAEGVDNHFRDLGANFWNKGMYPWEGTPFDLETPQDEDALVAKLNEYDIVLYNTPAYKDNDHETIRMYRVWKRLSRPLRITVVHNSIPTAVFKENISPLFYGESDYILVGTAEGSMVWNEIKSKIPGSEGKLVHMFNFVNLDEFMPLVKEFEDPSSRDDNVLWMGRYEQCRDANRLQQVVKHLNESNYASKLDFYAMGLENDTMTYWSFYNPNPDLGRLSTKVVDSTSPNGILKPDGRFDRDGIRSMLKNVVEPNQLKVFGRYRHADGMRLMASSKFGVETYGPWNDKVVDAYSKGSKIEYAMIEIMALSVPVFDGKYLSLLERTELHDSKFCFKINKGQSAEESLGLVKEMENLANDPKKYREAREWSLDYVRRHHSVSAFFGLLEDLHRKGKTTKPGDEKVLKSLYGKEVSLSDDLWVSFYHAKRGVPHYWSMVVKDPKKKKPEYKRVIAPKGGSPEDDE